MENPHIQFSFNFKDVILDEICLEGLEGIGLDLLWRRIEARISAPVTTKMKTRFWSFILNCKSISLYELATPLPHVEIFDRFTLVDAESGYLVDPPDHLLNDYQYSPIDNEYGSSVHYHTRILVCKDELMSEPYENVVSKFGDKLVMVATIEERWKALAPHLPMTLLNQMLPIHYCILELVGKSRGNGEMTVGKSNLFTLIKDPKLLFYNRSHLQKLDLICTQNIPHVVGNRAMRSLMLRIKRFHQPIMLSMPKVGSIHQLMQHLLKQPDYTDRVDTVVNMIITPLQVRRLRKTSNIFVFDDRLVTRDEVPNRKNKPKNPEVKKRFIRLVPPADDENSQLDEDINEEPLKCQYKVGVGLLRQAYERFEEAGLKGLTQVQVAELLGVHFYTSRTICRLFKSKNVVREYLEDKGKQRVTRYISVAATGGLDIKYSEEKNKFLKYMVESNTMQTNSIDAASQSDSEIPKKKIKLEDKSQKTSKDHMAFMEEDITEVDTLNGLDDTKRTSLFSTKKGPTLRQLKIANAIIKIIREKRAISGYHILSNLASIEANELPMDSKSMKLFICRLLADGQVKIMNIKWPGPSQKYTPFICAPDVKPTDPVIKAKYKEISLKAIKQKRIKKTTIPNNKTRTLALYTYPRYMKIQKLHELLISLTYLNTQDTDKNNMSDGFVSLVNIVPEFTVQFALGNISPASMTNLSKINITDDLLQVKLRNTSTEVFRTFLQSQSLQNCIRYNLKVLAMLGLVQLIKNPFQNEENMMQLSYVFFVNRNARILDTKGTWPRRVANKKALEKSYSFNSFQDVENYWADVYNISMKTTIVVNKEQRNRKKLMPTTRFRDEVVDNDNGQILGDGCGPCGFDSTFYMEIPRLWASYFSNVQDAPSKSNVHEKNLKLPKLTRKPKVVKKKKPLTKTEPKVRLPKPPVEKKLEPQKRKQNPVVSWTKEEDKIILFCKAAMSFMSSSSQPGCLRLRNIVARDILTKKDTQKIASNCHKRAKCLESNASMMFEKDLVMNEIKLRTNIYQKYANFLKKLRIRYSGNMTKIMYEGYLPMMELVWIMIQLSQSKSFNKRVPCIANNVEDFHSKFEINLPTTSRQVNWYKTPITEPCIAAIKEGIIMTMLFFLTRGEQSTPAAKQIYNMFNQHDDKTLRIAIDQMRKCCAVAAKEKMISNQVHRFNFRDIVHNSYRISANYQRKWISCLNSEFVNKLSQRLNSELPPSVTGCPSINCLLSEMQACDNVDIVSVTVPVITGSSENIVQDGQLSVTDINIKFKLKSGTCGLKNRTRYNSFSEYYQGLSTEEAFKALKRSPTIIQPDCDLDNFANDEIITHLMEKGETASSFRELQDITKYETKTLSNKLAELEAKNIIKRVGYFENQIVLTQYSKAWSMKLEGDHYIMPMPWLTLEKNIRMDIFLKWAGVILKKVFNYPGCSISYFTDTCEFISTRSAQDICMFLENVGCVRMNVINTPEPDLFSDDDGEPELEEYNQYESVDKILVFPVKDSLTRYAYVRSKLLDSCCEDM